MNEKSFPGHKLKPHITAEVFYVKGYHTTKPIMVFDEFNVHQGIEGDYGIVDWERTYPLKKYFIF